MTKHIGAHKGEIEDIVFLVGDPLRAKYISDNYLENSRMVSDIRNAYYFTGDYKGRRVTVGTSGMGSGSMGIYSYELFNFYDVKRIVRLGSCGSYKKELGVGKLVLATESKYDSDLMGILNLGKSVDLLTSSEELDELLLASSRRENVEVVLGRAHSSDLFYMDNIVEFNEKNIHAIVAEMESFSLFVQARRVNKEASCLLTVTDNLITGEYMAPEDRVKCLNDMIKVGLGILCDIK